jgi:hypothetical protein
MKFNSAILWGVLISIGVTGAASAQEWHPISRNSDRVYLADVGGMGVVEGVTTIMVARVVRRPSSPTDYSYTADQYDYRCATNQVRPGASVEYGEDGAETNRFEDGGDWETVRADTLDAYVKQVACDGERANPPVFPSIRAFMDAGRGN